MSNEAQIEIGQRLLIAANVTKIEGGLTQLKTDSGFYVWTEDRDRFARVPEGIINTTPEPSPKRPKRKRGPTLASVVESNANLKLGLERLRLRVNACEAVEKTLVHRAIVAMEARKEMEVEFNERLQNHVELNEDLKKKSKKLRADHEAIHADQWQRLQKLQTRQTRFERKAKAGAAAILILAAAFAVLAIGPHAALVWVEGAWRR